MSKMLVYALHGKSGTGKSFQAMNICRELDIPAIVDDGLFIENNKVIAGKSAKRAPTKVGAIKTALFVSDEHAKEVREAIADKAPSAILLIGTSTGMVEKICDRLELGKIDRYIDIEDITTKGERELAHKQRHGQGKHVIPAPTMQLKRQFSGYFIAPIKIFKGWAENTRGSGDERAVVRPTYSYLGDYTVSDKVFRDIIEYIGGTIPGINKVLSVFAEEYQNDFKLTVLISTVKGYPAVESAMELQRRSARDIDRMTAYNLEAVNVEVRDIAPGDERE